MRIAVTGASGLIGSAVAEILAPENELIVTGRGPSAALHVDMADPKRIRALPAVNMDALIHCAGIVDEDFREDRTRAFRQATDGMAELLSWAQRSGAKAVGYISSAHVYGPLEGIIDEMNVLNPQNDYAKAHYASEQLLEDIANEGSRNAVFRPCAVFGIPPDLDRFRRWSLTPFSFPRDAILNHAIVLKSDGRQRRNFVAADDVARSVALWLNSESEARFTAINPVGPDTLSMWDFAQICARNAQQIMGKTCEVRRDERHAPSLGADFHYKTIYPEHQGEIAVENSLRRLLATLQTRTE